MSAKPKVRVESAIGELADLIQVFASARGVRAAEKLCVVLKKIVVWAHDFGTGGVEANAKDHVFSERVKTRNYL